MRVWTCRTKSCSILPKVLTSCYFISTIRCGSCFTYAYREQIGHGLYFPVSLSHRNRVRVWCGVFGLGSLMNAPRGNGHYVPGPRPWRATMALSLWYSVFVFLMHFTGGGIRLRVVGAMILPIIPTEWIRGIINESTLGGHHTILMQKTLKFGFVLFILSEIMLFFSFFWSWFHSRLAPAVALGGSWPPIGLVPVNPYSLPLFNTVLLLRRGASVTWAHYQIVKGSYAMEAIWITVALGVVFIARQAVEYKLCAFALSDRVFGSVFYITTGLHGAHVLVGAAFLSVGAVRIGRGHFSATHHVGLEIAIWYWHFVDVVWLGLYVIYYVWVV